MLSWSGGRVWTITQTAFAPPFSRSDCISHWPALRKWSDAYLCSALGESLVTVAMTPNGLADALTPVGSSSCFALPHEEKMTMSTFLQLLGRKEGGLVPYLQYQNNSLLEEAAALAADVDAALPWAQAAFGASAGVPALLCAAPAGLESAPSPQLPTALALDTQAPPQRPPTCGSETSDR